MAEEAVLGFLHQNDEISDSGQFATQSGISHDEIVNVIKSLSAFHFVDAKVSLSDLFCLCLVWYKLKLKCKRRAYKCLNLSDEMPVRNHCFSAFKDYYVFKCLCLSFLVSRISIKLNCYSLCKCQSN